MSNKERYEYFDENGRNYAVDTVTGEKIEADNILVPVGSTVRTPAQKEAFKKHLEAERFKYGRKAANSELGDFFFILKEHNPQMISATNYGRLIYLLTYLGYNNVLMLTQRVPMKKSDLGDVMQLSKWTLQRFWAEICPTYIQEINGVLQVVNPDVIRGVLKQPGIYQKLYTDSIRKLYLSAKTTNHKYLSYIFQVIRYVNIEYNVLCSNPMETNSELIEPMTIGEFCECIDFDASHFCRLRSIYTSITFDVKGQQQYFLLFLPINNNPNDIRMFVNPRILYSGSNYEKVEALALLTKRKKRGNNSPFLHQTK